MDIVVTGRHVNVSDRFRRRRFTEKLAKVTQLAPRTRRVEVMVSHEPNRRQAKACERVEITCHDKGPVVRAEACPGGPVCRARRRARQVDGTPAPAERPAPGAAWSAQPRIGRECDSAQLGG